MRVTMRTFQQAVRGLPDLRNAPQTMDFIVRGQTFTADVTPAPDGGSCATVRGRGDCFTEADPAGTAQGPCGGDGTHGLRRGMSERARRAISRRNAPT